MYTKEPKEQQYSFSHNQFFLNPNLDENNIFKKIADSLNWNLLSENLAKFYCQNNGRPTKPARLKIGLQVVKHLNRLSDEETVELLKQNIYAQYLCDVSMAEAKKAIDATGLCRFRNKIGVDGTRLIEKEVQRILKEKGLLKGKKLIVDTTVVPSAIKYPTDINLLETVRSKAVKFLEEAKKLGAKTYRTYQRTAKRVFIKFQKIRRHTTRQRKNTQKKIKQFAQRNINQLKEALTNITVAGAKSFLKTVNEFMETADKIISQQNLIYKNLPVKDRIVSVWNNRIRPMVRGKFPINTEFGPKVLLNLKNRFLFLSGIFFDNVHDSTLLVQAIDENKKLLGYIPSQISTDRGFHSPQNQQYCQDIGIKKIAIQKCGKHVIDHSPPFWEKRLRRERCAIEAKISLAKRKFGLNRIEYRAKHGEEIWTRFSLMAMNLKLGLSPG